MTGSASALRSEFDAFLFAPIGDDNDNGMQLSVLSALARRNIDPWEEAARLSVLPSEAATRKLTELIAGLPGGKSTRPDAGPIAARLIALLPHRPSSGGWPGSDKRASAAVQGVRSMVQPRPVPLFVLYALSLAFVLVAQWVIANHLAAVSSDKLAVPVASAAAPAPAAPSDLNTKETNGSAGRQSQP